MTEDDKIKAIAESAAAFKVWTNRLDQLLYNIVDYSARRATATDKHDREYYGKLLVKALNDSTVAAGAVRDFLLTPADKQVLDLLSGKGFGEEDSK